MATDACTQEGGAKEMSFASPVTVVHPRIVATDRIIGKRVKNALGEYLGEVHHLMVDMASGSIVFAVLSSGGIMGLGEKLYPVPWQALTEEEDDFLLKMRKETMETAPNFDRGHWPKADDLSWFERVYRFYDYSPPWEIEIK
ncbi:PRC-barrel domain containing protein [Methanofollis formosanus]|uniref:PRC-barrel domain containing protein n=2 Tax=Methanofollis formosanus TaxID=299308 RepID=A0A8G1A078_9EURY|nr:PRC-barrel domain containing protein [Methanofollis formosanus]